MRFIVLYALSLFPLSSYAAPPTRHALMEATYASGFYEPTRGGSLELTYTEDGSPWSLTLAVPGRKLTARVWQASPSRCGDRIHARLAVPDEDTATDIELIDFTTVRCRLYVKHRWHATVDTRETDGSESKLVMEGDPQ